MPRPGALPIGALVVVAIEQLADTRESAPPYGVG
jgi:hypothetical protein